MSLSQTNNISSHTFPKLVHQFTYIGEMVITNNNNM